MDKVRTAPYPYTNYTVSENGVLTNTNVGNIITPYVNNTGYYVVRMWHANKSVSLLVHRLVAMCWLENPDPTRLTIVHHKDHDKSNNHYTNLEWATQRHNLKEARQAYRGLTNIPCIVTGVDHYYLRVCVTMMEAHQITGIPVSTMSCAFSKGRSVTNAHYNVRPADELDDLSDIDLRY